MVEINKITSAQFQNSGEISGLKRSVRVSTEGGKTFADVFKGVRAAQSTNKAQGVGISRFSQKGIEALQNINRDWRRVNAEINRISTKVPKELQPLLRAQQMFHELSLQTQVAAKSGEALSSSLKRLQQMSS